MSKHTVKIPASLKSYKDGIGAGLMYLAIGHFNIQTRKEEKDELVTVDFILSEQAEIYLKELASTHSKRVIFNTALAWVSRQPKHVQLSKI